MKNLRLARPALALGGAVALAPLTVAQVGGPPIPPTVAQFQIDTLDVFDGPSGTEVLVVERDSGVRNITVYSFDATGTLVLDENFGVNAGSNFELGQDRIVARAQAGDRVLQVYERNASGWSFAYELDGPALTAAIRYGDVSTLEGQTLYVSDPLNSAIDVYDLSTPGVALLVDTMSLPAGKFVDSMVVEDNTLLAHIGLRVLTGIEGGELVVYTDTGAGFEYLFNLPTGPEFDLGEFEVNLAITDNAFAVGFPLGTTNDLCGRVLVFDRIAGIVTQTAEILDEGECDITVALGTRFGRQVDFRGNSELLIAGGAQKGARQYVRTSNQWTPGPRHLTDTDGFDYAFARDWVIGLAAQGLQVFDNVSSITNEASVCAATIDAENSEWALIYRGSYSLSGDGGEFEVTFQEGSAFGNAADALALMLVGTERGHQVLGVSADICLSGRVRRVSMNTYVLGELLQADFVLDPAAFGAAPGEALFFQTWRREPGIVGGATTNALAITFIP